MNQNDVDDRLNGALKTPGTTPPQGAPPPPGVPPPPSTQDERQDSLRATRFAHRISLEEAQTQVWWRSSSAFTRRSMG